MTFDVHPHFAFIQIGWLAGYHRGGAVCLAWILQILLQLLYVAQQFCHANHSIVTG